MRTYDRATYLASQQAWADGEFGWQWNELRRLAAERGFLYPPSGSSHDDREAEEPSQRAIVWRALQDNPDGLRAIVRRSRSWHQVVDGIIGLEDRLRREFGEGERDAGWDREHDENRMTDREAVVALKHIVDRIAQS